MSCLWADVRWGDFNGTTVWDRYEVGQKPKTNSSLSRNEIIRSIEISKLPYTVAAFIYFDNGFEYVEDVKRYFYAETQSRTTQGETPNI